MGTRGSLSPPVGSLLLVGLWIEVVYELAIRVVPMNRSRLLLALAVALWGTGLLTPRTSPAATDIETTVAGPVGSAAVKFLKSLSADERQKAVFPLEDPERRDWSNLPRHDPPAEGGLPGDLAR